MRSFTPSTALALLLAAGGARCTESTASPAVAAAFPRAVAGNGYLAVPIGTVKRPHDETDTETNRASRRASRRASGKAFETILENMEVFYVVELGVGTPPQSVKVLVDTGSSELWLNPDCTTAPTTSMARQCVSFGRYDPRKSKTPPVGPFGSETINYGDPSDLATQTSVDIEYYSDAISFGAAQIKNQTFGVVTFSENQAQGILGLAPDLSGGFNNTGEPYSLVLNTMADQGLIASRVYSLDLRHAESDTGAVVYGGLDRNKFIGSLEKRPLVRGIQGEFRLAVSLDALSVTQTGSKGSKGSKTVKLTGDDTTVMLDSGTTLSRMHPRAAMPVLQALGAQSDGQGLFYVLCSLATTGGTVDFGFGGKTIRVPLSDFIFGAQGASRGDLCYLGLTMTTDQQILGDSVLRAGYFVFDWDNQNVHIAQAADCSGDSDIVAVGSGSDAVPSVQGNCKESDASATGRPLATPTSGNVPTAAYTTVFTVTSCPFFEPQCETGVVTTQTVQPAEATGAAAGGKGSGGDEKSAGARPEAAMGWIFTVLGVFAMGYNVL